MRSHPVGLDVWPFVYFHTSCVRTVNALARLRLWRDCGSGETAAQAPKTSLVAYVISTIISWAGLNYDLSYLRNEFHIINSSLIFTLCFYIGFVHYLWNLDLNLANKRRRKSYNRTCLVITFNSRHCDMTPIERYVGQSTIAFMYDVMSVVHGCMNLVSPKQFI